MHKVTVFQLYSSSLIAFISSTTLFSTSHYLLAQTATPSTTIPRTAYTIDFVSPYFKTQQALPTQKKPATVRTSKASSRCSDATLIEGETSNFLVKVCKENGRLLYIGKSKKEPNKPVRLPAKIVGKAKYRANNGSYSYIINVDGVEVWQNGRKIRSERFRFSKVFQH
ncbi:hypothetical protein NUACC21_75850 [Scytonema sp. NUACC21]